VGWGVVYGGERPIKGVASSSDPRKVRRPGSAMARPPLERDRAPSPSQCAARRGARTGQQGRRAAPPRGGAARPAASAPRSARRAGLFGAVRAPTKNPSSPSRPNQTGPKKPYTSTVTPARSKGGGGPRTLEKRWGVAAACRVAFDCRGVGAVRGAIRAPQRVVGWGTAVCKVSGWGWAAKAGRGLSSPPGLVVSAVPRRRGRVPSRRQGGGSRELGVGARGRARRGGRRAAGAAAGRLSGRGVGSSAEEGWGQRARRYGRGGGGGGGAGGRPGGGAPVRRRARSGG
jgi:translation initiation factor IF-2